MVLQDRYINAARPWRFQHIAVRPIRRVQIEVRPRIHHQFCTLLAELGEKDLSESRIINVEFDMALFAVEQHLSGNVKGICSCNLVLFQC